MRLPFGTWRNIISTPDGRLQQHKHKKQNNTTQQHAHETQKKIHLTQNSAALRFATAAASPQLRAGDRAPLRDGDPLRDDGRPASRRRPARWLRSRLGFAQRSPAAGLWGQRWWIFSACRSVFGSGGFAQRGPAAGFWGPRWWIFSACRSVFGSGGFAQRSPAAGFWGPRWWNFSACRSVFGSGGFAQRGIVGPEVVDFQRVP